MHEVISARDAFERGLTRYFSGLPCKYGHVAERMISNGGCVECLRVRRSKTREDNYARTKAWRSANPGARAEEARRYRAKHPDKVAAIKARHRERNLEAIRERDRLAKRTLRAVNPEVARERALRHRARKEAERAEVAGRPRPAECDVCGPLATGPIVFDHSHAHGGFRGWLCDRCNKLLGIAKDSPELLRDLALYLEKDHEQTHRQAA